MDEELNQALRLLQAGEVIGLPTDTVYGLGLSPLHARSPQALFDVKGRNPGKPVAWLVGTEDALAEYGENVAPEAFALARAFWPGPLTLIVQASRRVPEAFRAADGTLGLRMPNHPVTLRILRLLGSPLAVTSANASGQPAARVRAELTPDIGARIPLALDDRFGSDGAAVKLARTSLQSFGTGMPSEALTASRTSSGTASTVVDCSHGSLKLLREGDLTREALSRACGVAVR